jgi:uncharacterized protein YwqG
VLEKPLVEQARCFANEERHAMGHSSRFLLQVDSDDAAGMMWGDAGMLYFWIRDDDLAARRFDRAWCVMQCY